MDQRHQWGSSSLDRGMGTSSFLLSSVASQWFRALGERTVLNRKDIHTKMPVWHIYHRASHITDRRNVRPLCVASPGECSLPGQGRLQPDVFFPRGFRKSQRFSPLLTFSLTPELFPRSPWLHSRGPHVISAGIHPHFQGTGLRRCPSTFQSLSPGHQRACGWGWAL